MTAVAVRPTAGLRGTVSEPVSCEVRCPGMGGVFGYILAGNGAACLEKALADNGFRLVPTAAGPSRRTTVAA